jgi:hypothetical protein
MTTITHKRLVSAFKKAGCEVINVPRFGSEGKVSNRWMAKNVKDGRSVEWHVQAGFDAVTKTWDESNLITTYVVKRSPHTDIMTDCFCDTFYHTIRESVRAIA